MEEEINAYLSAVISEAKSLATVCFYSGVCSSCKNMMPHVETVSLCFTGLSFIFIDVDKNPTLMESFNIETLPHFIFFKNELKICQISTNCVADFVKELKKCISLNEEICDLVTYIDRKSVKTENCSVYEGFCKSLFQGNEYLESDEGSAIVLSIPFKKEVSISQIVLRGPKLDGPKEILFFKNVRKENKPSGNERDMESELEILVPTQIVIATQKQLLGLEVIDLDKALFSDIVKLDIVFRNSQTSSSIIRIDRLCFKGTENLHQNRKLEDITNRYGLIEKKFGVQFNIKREEKVALMDKSDVIVVILDTNVTTVPRCQQTILDIEARCQDENRIVRFIFPYMMMDELQLGKDLAIPGETIEEKNLRRLWENKSARFIMNCIKKENFYIQSKSMMENLEKESERPSLTADESIIRCAVQQNKLSSENSRCVLLTYDTIAQLFSFGHLIFAYDCEGLQTLLQENKSIDDILITNQTAAKPQDLSPGYTEKIISRRSLRFMESLMKSFSQTIEALWSLKKIVSNSPTYLCVKDCIISSFKHKLARIKEKHTRILNMVIGCDANIPIESKKAEMLKQYSPLWETYYNLENECISVLYTSEASKGENLSRVDELKNHQSRLLVRLDEAGLMRSCPTIKKIPYNLAIDSRKNWQEVKNTQEI